MFLAVSYVPWDTSALTDLFAHFRGVIGVSTTLGIGLMAMIIVIYIAVRVVKKFLG